MQEQTTFLKLLLIDGIFYDDVKAVKENWMDKTTLRIGGHLSIPSFKTYKCKTISTIQNGIIQPLDKVDIYQPFLALVQKEMFYDIFYISYRQ